VHPNLFRYEKTYYLIHYALLIPLLLGFCGVLERGFVLRWELRMAIEEDPIAHALKVGSK
jgi:hypothetical protein